MNILTTDETEKALLDRIFSDLNINNGNATIAIISEISHATLRFANTLAHGDFLLLNIDKPLNETIFLSKKINVITYGANSKACITISSITSSEFKDVVCCVQRKFLTIDKKTVDEQEFNVRADSALSSVRVLAVVGALLICGVSADTIVRIF